MDSNNELLEKSFPRKENRDSRTTLWIKTIFLIAVWVTMGISQVMTPTTLPDVMARLDVDVETISRTFSIGAVGSIVGAPLGSFADRYNTKVDAIIGCGLMVCAVTLATRCLTTSTVVFTFNIFIDGLVWACINAVGNSLMMDLWGEKGSSPMHALHFGYPIGATLGPLIAYSFVSRSVNESLANETRQISIVSNINPRFKDNSRIEIPYAIVAVFIAIVSICFVVFQFVIPSKNIASHQNKVGFKWKDVFSPRKWAGEESNFGITIIIFMMCFYALHVITLKASLTYYVTYAVKVMEYTNQQATLLTSIASFAATLGRALSIIFAYFVPIHVMLLTEVHGQALFAIITLVWGIKDKTLFLIFNAVFAFFREPIWPSGYTWTDQYIALYAIVVGLADIAAKIANVLFSWLLGYLYTYTVKESLFYNTAVAGILLCVLTITMNYVAEKHGKRFKKVPPKVNNAEAGSMKNNCENEHCSTDTACTKC